MSKQLHFKSLLLLLAMVLGVGTAWAADDAVYTLDGTITGGSNAYAEASNITQNGMDWLVVGNTTTSPWRIGGKSLDGVDRDITGKTAFTQAVNKITFNHAGTTSDNLIVNSVTLTVASDADFNTVIDEVTLQPEVSKNTEGSFDFTPSSPLTEWSTGCYYKFTINISNSKDSNYGFCPTSIVFYAESSKTSTSTAIDATGLTNTNLFAGTSAGQLTATVTAGETTVTNAAITWTSSVPGVATVDENGNVTLVAAGTTVIKATYDGDENYLGSVATYELSVVNNDPSNLRVTFEFSANKYNWPSTNDGSTYFDGSKYTATEGDISIGFSGKVRLWVSNGSYTMRFYSDETYGRGKMTLTAADGFVITGVSISGSTLSFQNPSSGTINGGEWTGSAKVLTIEKGSSTSNFTTVVVSYKQDSGISTPTVTIDATGITSTDVYEGTDAGSLAATVTYNDTDVEGAAVTWSGNNDEVATIDENTGAVTLVAAGSVTFTATFAGNDNYNEASETYEMTVTDSTPSTGGDVTFVASVDKGNTTAGEGSITKDGVTMTCSNGILGNGTEYRLYKNSVTTFSTTSGTITKIVFTGTSTNPASGFGSQTGFTTNGNDGTWTGSATTVSFTASGAQVRATQIAVTIDMNDKADAELSYGEETSFTVNIGEEFTAPTLTNPNNLTVTYASDNEEVAMVDEATGEVVLMNVAGTAVITATFAGDENFKEGEASFTITVVDPNVKGTESNPYTIADVIDGTANGGNNIYVKGFIVGSWVNNKFDPENLVNSNLALADSPDETEGSMTIPVELKSAFRPNFGLTDGGKAYNIGVAQVLICGNAKKYFNVNGVKELSSITKVAEQITISDAGYKTWCTDVDLDFSETGWLANAMYMDGTTIKSSLITDGKVKAETGILLKGDAGSMLVPVAEGAEEQANNILIGTTAGETVDAPVFVLMDEAAGVGFYKTKTAFTLGAHTAYLPADVAGSRTFIAIDNDHGTTTGIAEIETMRNWDNETVYNLNGQRVSKATKGLYIVKGKKVKK